MMTLKTHVRKWINNVLNSVRQLGVSRMTFLYLHNQGISIPQRESDWNARINWKKICSTLNQVVCENTHVGTTSIVGKTGKGVAGKNTQACSRDQKVAPGFADEFLRLPNCFTGAKLHFKTLIGNAFLVQKIQKINPTLFYSRRIRRSIPFYVQQVGQCLPLPVAIRSVHHQ